MQPDEAAISNLQATVVVPVRNRPELLCRTLATLVEQDLQPSSYEIIVCDDGSADDIATAVGKVRTAVRIRLVSQPPRGPAAARNLGVRASLAPIVVFIDSDVIVDRSALRCLLGGLNANPHWQGAEACLVPTGGGAGPLWDAPSSVCGGGYHTAAIAYRREVLAAVGGFDESFTLPACEDVELASRVLARGPIGFVPQARVYHPRRKVTAAAHWRWRRHWRYEAILAVRYGILAFPGKPCGPFPRLRVACAAVLTLPGGRLLNAIRAMPVDPEQAVRAASYAVFDILCGLVALPAILFAPVPERSNHLADHNARRIGGDDINHQQRNFAVIIAAHKEYETLALCLNGFRRITAKPEDVIFVDNSSAGALSEKMKQHLDGITVLTLRENRLFCGGYNAGLRHAMERNYAYALIVNADSEVVSPAFVEILIDEMQRQPRVAFAGPLVYYRRIGVAQTTCLRFPSVLRSILVWIPFRFLPQLISRQSARLHDVEFLNGVCVLCRVRALAQIGLMDESFGAYQEDADWSWRASRLGWKSVFVPVPSIIHHEEAHGYEHHSFKSFLLKRNAVYWFLKAGKPWSARLYAHAALLLARIRTIKAGREKRRSYRAFCERLRADYRRLLRGETPALRLVSSQDGGGLGDSEQSRGVSGAAS